jgi:hypothetical protein
MQLFHFLTTADIYDEILPELQRLGLHSDCVGGGRIEHNSDVGTILVYGYSIVSTFTSFHFLSSSITPLGFSVTSKIIWC